MTGRALAHYVAAVSPHIALLVHVGPTAGRTTPFGLHLSEETL
jgi:hypothetical protein